jgi:hypothetical protein
VVRTGAVRGWEKHTLAAIDLPWRRHGKRIAPAEYNSAIPVRGSGSQVTNGAVGAWMTLLRKGRNCPGQVQLGDPGS